MFMEPPGPLQQAGQDAEDKGAFQKEVPVLCLSGFTPGHLACGAGTGFRPIQPLPGFTFFTVSFSRS